LADVFSSGSSLKLGTLFGIRIGVSASWFIVLFLLLYFFTDSFSERLGISTSAAFAVAVTAAVLFFGSILLHELGHALAAKREGIEVAGIDLFIFGGVMKMNREGGTWGAMFRIAAAGPAVTLAIVAVTGAAALVLLGLDGTIEAALLDAIGGTTALEQLVSLVFGLNVILLIFNLLPALPLDGGQILRALVWGATKDRGKGTKVAAVLGQGLGYALMAYGVYLLFQDSSFSGIWSLGLGFLVLQGARAATAQEAFTERLDGVTVADVMDHEPVTIPAGLGVAEAWETYFERYHGSQWFAVTEPDGRFVGLAHRAAVQDVIDGADGLTVRQVATAGETDAHVPADASLEALIGSEPLRRHGALMALDREGRLSGVVTVDQVSRALRAQLASPLR